jgi:hypothetical protein
MHALACSWLLIARGSLSPLRRAAPPRGWRGARKGAPRGFVGVGLFFDVSALPRRLWLACTSHRAFFLFNALHGSRHALLPPPMTLIRSVMLGIRGGPLSRLGRQSTLSPVGYFVLHRRRRFSPFRLPGIIQLSAHG